MYSVKGIINEGFTTKVKTTNGSEYAMYIKDGDSPMDFFTVAYSGCIAMCVKGYFFRTYELVNLPVEINLDVDYDNKKIVANIFVERTVEELDNGDREGALENVKLRCKVSHLLDKELDISYNVQPLDK